MQFGVVIQTDPPASRVVELARMAEENGFAYAWTFDSHVLWQEPFVIYSQMLAATERMIVGPMVTNPGTRDWTVIASLFATLNEMFDGRTICGMGRGDSALRYIGQKPTTLATMVESMKTIKALVAGESVEINGKEIRIPWISEGEGWDLPMWGAGYGPKALATVGEHCDGYILQLADPQVLEWTMGAVRKAAEEAGRNPDDISICVAAPAYVGDDIAHQREQVRWFGGMVGNHVADLVDRYGKDGLIPKALTDYIEARRGYDYAHHGRADNPSTDFVPDDIVDRFCVLGTAEDHIAKLTELKEMGVDQFGIYLMHDNKEATLEAYGEKVIPALDGLESASS
ncbi:MAG TPA: TIGR03842 family LLM class F420-dependent oxidoreductase [Acidimicrobiia bacterium]|nr:TIGR03842 family LLM class F420-dependent oxidoreductase [Acidimicrobiia bacterium]